MNVHLNSTPNDESRRDDFWPRRRELETNAGSFEVRLPTNGAALLGVERRAVAESLDSPLVRSLVGRSLLTEALRRLGFPNVSPRYEYGPFGKPYLAELPNVFFNVSHCADAVVCVVANAEIGVDVESVSNAAPDVAPLVFNARELVAVESDPDPARAFTRLWTMKESFVKFLGTGLDELDAIKTLLDGRRPDFWSASGPEYEITVCFGER